MTHIDGLSVAWKAFRGMNPTLETHVALDLFNAQQIVTSQRDIPVNEILHYLAGKLRIMNDYVLKNANDKSDSYIAAADFYTMLSFPGFGPFMTSNPQIYATLKSMLLTAAANPDCGLTGDDVQAIMALSNVTQNFAQANNYGQFITNAQLTERGLS
jgi:hypothetical protein